VCMCVCVCENSFELKNTLDSINIGDDDVLISLDVVCMYSNIPIELVNNIITKKWNKIKEYTNIPFNEFIYALTLTLNKAYFQYDGKFYQQVFGCAMGAPISSVIAQLVLEDLENNIIPKLNFQPTLYKRYVDDCLIILPKNKIEYITEQFNSYHHKLQFTVEKEINNSINYLDVTIIRKNNKLFTKLYHKPTASGRYLHYNSVQPNNQKNVTIINLVDRALKLTSCCYRKEVLNKIQILLKNNGYPEKNIKKIIKERVHKFYNNNHTQYKNNEDYKYISLPYISGLSEKIKKVLRHYNIKIGFRNENKLGKFFSKTKDKTPKMLQTHIVYQIPCKSCNSVYIGQTSQHLKDRINGHKYSNNITALKNHQINTDHCFDFDSVKIIDKEQKLTTRNFLEMIHIKKHPNAVNNKSEINNLSKLYHYIIN